jgi:hypothetical protein
MFKKFFNFKKRGNALISTTTEQVPEPKITNILKANEVIQDLKAENTAIKDAFGVESEVVTTRTPQAEIDEAVLDRAIMALNRTANASKTVTPAIGQAVQSAHKTAEMVAKEHTAVMEKIAQETALARAELENIKARKEAASMFDKPKVVAVPETKKAIHTPVMAVSTSATPPTRIDNVPRYRIVKEEYEIAMGQVNGIKRVYIRSIGSNSIQHNNGGWVVLGWNANGNGSNTSNIANQEKHPDVTRDLTVAEFDAIRLAKPTLSAIRSQYRFGQNTTVTLTHSDPILVW